MKIGEELIGPREDFIAERIQDFFYIIKSTNKTKKISLKNHQNLYQNSAENPIKSDAISQSNKNAPSNVKNTNCLSLLITEIKREKLTKIIKFADAESNNYDSQFFVFSFKIYDFPIEGVSINIEWFFSIFLN